MIDQKTLDEVVAWERAVEDETDPDRLKTLANYLEDLWELIERRSLPYSEERDFAHRAFDAAMFAHHERRRALDD